MEHAIQQYAAKIAAGWKPLSDQQRRLLALHFNKNTETRS